MLNIITSVVLAALGVYLATFRRYDKYNLYHALLMFYIVGVDLIATTSIMPDSFVVSAIGCAIKALFIAYAVIKIRQAKQTRRRVKKALQNRSKERRQQIRLEKNIPAHNPSEYYAAV